MKKSASIDIGSNSLLLLIGSFSNGKLQTVYEEAQITGLGKGIDATGFFNGAAMVQTLKVLCHFKKIIEKYEIGQTDILVTATEASRVAKNSAEFYLKVKEDCGFTVRILSGKEEAYYTALGVNIGMNPLVLSNAESILMDIGGASTELIRMSGNPFKIVDSISLPVGAVRAQEWMDQGAFKEKFQSILPSQSILKSYQTKNLVSVAGTMTSIAAMLREDLDFNPYLVQNFIYTPAELETLYGKLTALSKDEIHLKYPYLGKRVETIVPGVRVALEFAKLVNCRTLETSCYGLRYGTLFEHLTRS